MNTNLKKNIDRYMDLKGIRYYTDLLIAIAKTQGMKQDAAIAFANKEKSNFSKMLSGERPLKYDYIIPLETIFGIPLAKILNDQPYFESINKDDIPYIKSFRYYAYKDDLSLYDELDKTYTSDGESVICNSDEFNRFFLDYLIEYKAFNGLRYLVEEHDFKLNHIYSNFFQIDGSMCAFSTLFIQAAKFVIDSNDGDLFNKVFDPFEYLMRYSYREMDCLYKDKEFIEAVLNNKNVFDSLFVERNFAFDDLNARVYPHDGIKSDIICTNPLLNICLDYCLTDIAKYKEQAKKILKFGLSYNKKILGNLRYPINEYCVDTGGNVSIGRAVYANLIYTDKINSGDSEIDELIKNLPSL